jgi:CheY-like chemotaxis protein/signal transduction histidine kinase
MEIFKNTFLKGDTFLLVLSSFSAWLLLAIITAMLIIVFKIYKAGLASSENRNDALVRQLQGLQQQFDYASRQEIKSRAEAERAGAARDKLLSSLSHEIRTPMNGILGMAVLLEETTLGTDQREYLDTIISSGKILLNKVNEVMANDMLDHSKIDLVNPVPLQKNIDIRNCVEEVLQMFAVKAADCGIDLLYEIAADVPTQITGDDKRLHQILINLVEIVIDTAKQQEVFIGVHLFKDETSKSTMLGFEVNDERNGNSAKVLQRLSVANRLKEYTVEEEQESGLLGLAIAKRLVEEMGGEIRTTSNTGIADNFIFNIPFGATTHVADTTTGYTMKGFEGSRILIVNASTTASDILKKQLDQWRLISENAGSGKQALEILATESFSMIILGIEMQDMDGIELAKLIKNKYPDLPLLLLNPLNDERYKQHEEIFEELVILNKPVKQHVLFDTILTTLRGVKNGNNTKEFSIKNLSPDFARQYPLRILIAEDNPVNQKWATKILSKMGYEATIAENGHLALEKVGQSEYDLILMDVQMPEMDGIEATKMIRVCLQKQPVIIAMTANVMHGDRQACMQAGMDDYISKPVELGELVGMLEKWAVVIQERKLVLKD